MRWTYTAYPLNMGPPRNHERNLVRQKGTAGAGAIMCTDRSQRCVVMSADINLGGE